MKYDIVKESEQVKLIVHLDSYRSKGETSREKFTSQDAYSIINEENYTGYKLLSKPPQNLDNKFDLTSYQDDVENNLVNKIIEELIIFINL